MVEPNPLPSKRTRNFLRLCLMTIKKKPILLHSTGSISALWCNMGLDRSADHASVTNLPGQLKRCLKLDCDFVIWYEKPCSPRTCVRVSIYLSLAECLVFGFFCGGLPPTPPLVDSSTHSPSTASKLSVSFRILNLISCFALKPPHHILECSYFK